MLVGEYGLCVGQDSVCGMLLLDGCCTFVALTEGSAMQRQRPWDRDSGTLWQADVWRQA
jgi:hypothetical protein